MERFSVSFSSFDLYFNYFLDSMRDSSSRYRVLRYRHILHGMMILLPSEFRPSYESRLAESFDFAISKEGLDD